MVRYASAALYHGLRKREVIMDKGEGGGCISGAIVCVEPVTKI